MTAINQDLTIKQGEDFSVDVPALNPDGSQIDTRSGYRAIASIKRDVRGSSPPITTLDSSLFPPTIIMGLGKVTIKIPYATTAAFKFNTVLYDVFLVKTNTYPNQSQCLQQGRISLQTAATTGF